MFAHVVNELEKVTADAPVAEIPVIIGELERIKTMLWTRMVSGQASGNGAAQAQDQASSNVRYLTVAQVVGQFGVTARWLYRNKKKLPHSQPSRKVLLFPEAALQRWFKKMS